LVLSNYFGQIALAKKEKRTFQFKSNATCLAFHTFPGSAKLHRVGALFFGYDCKVKKKEPLKFNLLFVV